MPPLVPSTKQFDAYQVRLGPLQLASRLSLSSANMRPTPSPSPGNAITEEDGSTAMTEEDGTTVITDE